MRDFTSVIGKNVIDEELVGKAFKDLRIDDFGLNDLDRKYLFDLVSKFKGGPVGIEALSTALGEDKGTIEDIVEPYLVKIDFISRTPKGRIATNKAKTYLKERFNLDSDNPTSNNTLF